jgi:arabinose-5-phosphate isomerase
LPAEQILADARAVIHREGNATFGVADQLDNSFVRAVEMVLDCRGKVIAAGSGTSGSVARRMAHLLSVCGTPALFTHPMDGLHGSLGAVSDQDMIIAVSRDGGSGELNDFARLAQQRGAPVLSLTSRTDSPLGQLADLSVRIVTKDADPGGVIAMGSTLAAAAWGDALAITLMRPRGYSWSEVLFTHPAGAVGQLIDTPAELTPYARREQG